MGLEVLEKMLDEFDILYNNKKADLLENLLIYDNLSEKKMVLDEFFGKIDGEACFIKNS